MALESATYIGDLVATNPPGGDRLKQADDHIRLIKSSLQASFPDVEFARYIEQPRVDVSDSATPNLWGAESDFANLLGTTTVTGLASGTEGQQKLVRFAEARQLTYNATTMDLPGTANFNVVAGDYALFRCRGGTSNKLVWLTRADGKAMRSELPTQVSGDNGANLQANGAGATAWVQPASTTGFISMWPTSSVPTGWLECNGAAISRTTFAALFAVIGTTYGPGNGSTTFNIPDLRGRFVRAWDHGATRDSDSSFRTNRGDGTTGDNVGTIQLDDLESHRHFVVADEQSGNPGNPAVDNSNQICRHMQSGSNTTNYLLTGSALDSTQGRSSATGGSETRPHNINLMFVIKT
jgi:microcystin-dependent protein